MFLHYCGVKMAICRPLLLLKVFQFHSACVKATRRHSVKLEDNSTVIFDIFEPTAEEKQKVYIYTSLIIFINLIF